MIYSIMPPKISLGGIFISVFLRISTCFYVIRISWYFYPYFLVFFISENKFKYLIINSLSFKLAHFLAFANLY